MMRIDVITAFPEYFRGPFGESMIRQARRRVGLEINLWDLRDFTHDAHRTVDDTPYGGGAGMVMKPEPFFEALEYLFGQGLPREQTKIIYPSPQGKVFTNRVAQKLAQEKSLVFLCGHYKGIDQRVIDYWVDEEISIGDYVLTGGELATVVIVDAVIRWIPGVVGDIESVKSDSFEGDLLDAPYYTRPEIYRGLKVPDVLRSGNHQAIERWRLEKRIEKTRAVRPDLYKKFVEKNKL